jgi:hypothetical protein
MASNQYVAADQCEPDLGVQLNGDGDLDDCVAVVIAPSGSIFDTSDPARGTPRHTIVPCTGDVCDDTDPFKIFPFGEDDSLAKIRHLSVESQEPALFADLNGDGDALDVVVREFVAGANVAFPPIGVPGEHRQRARRIRQAPAKARRVPRSALVGYCGADGDGSRYAERQSGGTASRRASGTTPCRHPGARAGALRRRR